MPIRCAYTCRADPIHGDVDHCFVGVLVRTPSSLGYRDIVRVRLRRSARPHPFVARLS